MSRRGAEAVWWFRHADARYAPLRGDPGQPPARWHGPGEGPVQYLADTPEGAWAEFVRHEAITDAADLAGVARNLWAVAVDESAETIRDTMLVDRVLLGGPRTYRRCQREARALRSAGATALRARQAALLDGAACGQLTVGGRLRDAPPRDGVSLVLFGSRAAAPAFLCAERASPPERVLALVRHLPGAGRSR